MLELWLCLSQVAADEAQRESERGRKNRNALRLSPPWNGTSVNYPHILENLQSFANVNEKL